MSKQKPKLSLDVRIHFLKRIRERSAIELTLEECKSLESHRAGFFLHRDTWSRWWFLMRIHEQWVYCLHQKGLGFTTVLTPEQFWESHPSLKLRYLRAEDKFADVWMAARADQKKYQPKKKKVIRERKTSSN